MEFTPGLTCRSSLVVIPDSFLAVVVQRLAVERAEDKLLPVVAAADANPRPLADTNGFVWRLHLHVVATVPPLLPSRSTCLFRIL